LQHKDFVLEISWSDSTPLEDRRTELVKLDRHIFNVARSSYPFPGFSSTISYPKVKEDPGLLTFRLTAESNEVLSSLIEKIKTNWNRITISGNISTLKEKK